MHIVGVQLYALGIARIASSADLPETGDPRPYTPVHFECFTVHRYLRVHYGPGADQAHLSSQDVPELRQLVQAGLAQKKPDSSDARVIAQLKVPLPFRPQMRVAL